MLNNETEMCYTCNSLCANRSVAEISLAHVLHGVAALIVLHKV